MAAYALFAGALATLYVVVQQDGRHAVEDAPRALLSAGATSAGATDANAARSNNLDLDHYLGTFWVSYDAAGRPTAGDGYLGGSLARVPHGVLQTAQATGEDAVSWQPEPGLRFAIVAQPLGDGVIVAGRSLQPTEQRASRTLLFVAGALVAGLVVVGAAVAADALVARRRSFSGA
ncbi:hypothetical protein KNO15_10070 [Leifsonia shinshuensis]|uniref:hypothetical protein n=1 Tax=Leifsonia shinshuensis TaxID=150026 RepID=UPI001F50FCA3|nr:hypothetical protein [Leifsonia shinshuensis]MCI0157040.1 hypothetical protein [Leifsonia shinshuensis]